MVAKKRSQKKNSSKNVAKESESQGFSLDNLAIVPEIEPNSLRELLKFDRRQKYEK